LKGLLENVGGLNEEVINKMARKIMEGVRVVHGAKRYYEGSLTTEQVLLDREGNVKISLGLSTNLEINSPSRRENPLGSVLSMQNPIFHTNSENKENIRKAQSNDLYNIGLICLMSAIGDPGLLGYSDEEIEKVHKESCSQQKKGFCCILHSEKSLVSRKITLLEILEKKGFSGEFISFLCQALRFNWQERGNIESLFDRVKNCQKAHVDENNQINLKELIKIGLFWESHKENDEKTGIKFLEKLLESIKVVMPNCENWFIKEEYKPYLSHLNNFNEENEVFKNLEKELGVRKEVIFEKMKKVFKEFGFMGKEGD